MSNLNFITFFFVTLILCYDTVHSKKTDRISSNLSEQSDRAHLIRKASGKQGQSKQNQVSLDIASNGDLQNYETPPDSLENNSIDSPNSISDSDSGFQLSDDSISDKKINDNPVQSLSQTNSNLQSDSEFQSGVSTNEFANELSNEISATEESSDRDQIDHDDGTQENLSDNDGVEQLDDHTRQKRVPSDSFVSEAQGSSTNGHQNNRGSLVQHQNQKSKINSAMSSISALISGSNNGTINNSTLPEPATPGRDAPINTTNTTDTEPKAYCILYPDESFICPNDRQRARIYEHIHERRILRCMILMGTLFFVIILCILRGKHHYGAQNSRPVFHRVMNDVVLLMSIFMILFILLQSGVIQQIHIHFFGGHFSEQRLDVAAHMTGDVREGALLTETGIIALDELMIFGAIIPVYVLMLFLADMNIMQNCSMLRRWEAGVYTEHVVVENKNFFHRDRLDFLCLKRIFTKPQNIFPRLDIIDSLGHKFMLSRYFSACMVDVSQYLMSLSKGALILLLILLALPKDDDSFHPTKSVKVSCYMAVICAILVGVSIHKVRFMKHRTLPHVEAYLDWAHSEEAKGEDVRKLHIPEHIVPLWKRRDTPPPAFLNYLWYGTFIPTRQHTLWFGGPNYVLSLVHLFTFMSVVASGSALHDTFVNVHVLKGFITGNDYHRSFHRDLKDWDYIYAGITFGCTFVIFNFMLPKFIMLYVLAAKVDSLIDKAILSKEAASSHRADAGIEELLASLFLHKVYVEASSNLMQSKYVGLAMLRKLHTPQELDVLSTVFYSYSKDPYSGLSEDEGKALLQKLGLDREDYSYAKWQRSFHLTKAGYMNLEEFQYMIAVHEGAITEVLPRQIIAETLKKLANVRSSAVKAAGSDIMMDARLGSDRISLSVLKACFESLSVSKERSQKWVDKLAERLNPARSHSDKQEEEGSTNAQDETDHTSIDVITLADYLYEEQIMLKTQLD